MDDATTLLHASMPLCATLGFTAGDTVGPDKVEMHVEWSPELCTTANLLHGGLMMALADSAGAMCAFFNLPEGATGTSTIESKTNFLGGVSEGTVTASSTPLHTGRTTIVVETELRNGDRLVAKVTQTQAVLHP